MKKIVILICGLLAMSATAVAQTPEEDKNAIVKVGMDVPEFTAKMLDGTEINIADLKGKVVLINFWTTWCPWCVKEFTRVQADIIDRFEGKEFVFIALSRGEEKATVEKFMKSKGYTFPVALDGDSSIFGKFATTGIPRNFVIDRDGKVVYAFGGYKPEEFDAMIALIEGMLKE